MSKVIFCGRFTTTFFNVVSSSSSSSLESVRNSAGNTSGSSFCVRLCLFDLVFCAPSSSSPSSGASFSPDLLGFVRFRFSACCFRRLSRACRFLFVDEANLQFMLVFAGNCTIKRGKAYCSAASLAAFVDFCISFAATAVDTASGASSSSSPLLSSCSSPSSSLLA